MRATRSLSIDPNDIDTAALDDAAEVIRSGGLVAFPTETVYGLGANALDPDAVARIFAAKERPAYDPVIVHIAAAEGLAQLVTRLDARLLALAAIFWPGPLTLVLPRSSLIPDVVTAGGPNVALRCPAHPVALALIAAAGVPIAAPSANRFSRTSPTCAEHVLADLDGRIDLVLDGGPTQVGVESTVLDLTRSVPTVLRPGGVTVEELRAVLGAVEVRTQAAPASETMPAPGMLERHYAPRAALILLEGEPASTLALLDAELARYTADGRRVGVMAYDEDVEVVSAYAVEAAPLGPYDMPAQAARMLFAAMRLLDAAGVDVVLVRQGPAEGVGAAVRNRLERAAHQRVATQH